MSSKHDRSTQCRSNAGPLSPALAINHSTLDSAFCWRWCVHRVQADNDPMSVKCWASVAVAGQYPFSPSQYFMLAGESANSAWRAAADSELEVRVHVSSISQVCIYRLLKGL